jgi:dienelactone hydrolase
MAAGTASLALYARLIGRGHGLKRGVFPVLAAMVIVASCAPEHGPIRTAPSTATTTTTAAAATTAPPPPARDGTPRFAVGTIVRDFIDPGRQRTLHTIVHFPAKGPAGQAGSDPAGGAFPLVLMAHGYRLPAGGYERILDMVTATGYIVAAPAFPHTSAERGDGDRSDIVNQPADLSFVADAVIDLATRQPELLPEIADPAHLAALGHSDGGLTVSAWAYDNTFRDRRVAAAVVMSGGIGLFPGTYFAPDSPPLLAIHATADEVNPYSASVGLFDAVPVGIPRFLLTINGGSHLGPYMFDAAMPEVGQAVVDFLDGYLLGLPGGRERLMVDGNRAGIVTLRGG